MRRFLYTIVFLIILVIAVLFALRVFGEELTEVALVPRGEFVQPAPLADNAWQDPGMWFSRPGMGAVNDPARWQPEVTQDPELLPVAAQGPANDATAAPADIANTAASGPLAEPLPAFAVFFVHPTSYLTSTQWNAPLDDEASQERARLMVRGMASAFNGASEIWAPRYRQATFGAFLTDAPEAQQALDAAYADVSLAFDFFLDSIAEDMPIVLAGHSQGAYHVNRLLAERIAGTQLQQRIAMAYPIGWPLSLAHDLPALGLPACATPDQAGCVMSWASFAEPADPGQFLRRYGSTPGFDGQNRVDSAILCVNPLTGMLNDTAGKERNLGTLVPSDDLSTGELVPGAVPARCAPSGLLLIGDPPDLGPYVLPGENYHVYDIPLFWVNLQQDVVRRVGNWAQAR